MRVTPILPLAVLVAVGCTSSDSDDVDAAAAGGAGPGTGGTGVGGQSAAAGSGPAGAGGGAAGTVSTAGTSAGGSAGTAGAAVACTQACGAPACPCPQTPMVEAELSTGGTVFIDMKEVDNASFQLFLAANPGPSAQAACADKTSFAPTADPDSSSCQAYTFDPVTFANHPVNCLQWCDADRYCTWRGARLCSPGEWVNACAGPTNSKYFYGDTYSPGVCNNLEAASKGTVVAGSFMGCKGPSGIVDMAGNVREFTSQCDAGQCRLQGGSFNTPGDKDVCKTGSVTTTDFAARGREFGFRCCRDPG